MKIYKTNEDVIKDIKNGVLAIEGDVTFECSISISASIIVTAGNINARDINAWDINAWDITARDITAWNINAGDINAGDINAGDINAGNITAGDINAWDITARNINARNINAGNITAWNITAWGNITAWDITARNILYSAFCCVYQNIKCLSIKAKRTTSKEPICLEGKLEIKEDEKVEELTLSEVCKQLGKNIKIIK
jgi:hypothetical protein